MTPFDKEGYEGILDILYTSDVKLTAQHFVKQIKSRYDLSSRDAEKILTRLIDEQELSYHYLERCVKTAHPTRHHWR